MPKSNLYAAVFECLNFNFYLVQSSGGDNDLLKQKYFSLLKKT